MIFQEECAYCPHWGDWESRCDYYGWCPTKERAEKMEEELNGGAGHDG